MEEGEEDDKALLCKLSFVRQSFVVIIIQCGYLWKFIFLYYKEEYIEEYIDYKIIINLVGNYCHAILK